MTDRDEQLEAQLRARPLPGLSAEARRRLLADLALAPLDHDNPPTEATTDQILPNATRTHRQTIWRTMITHRYAAACVAVIMCAAIAGAAILAHRMSDDADSDLALHRSNPPAVAHGPSASGKSVAIEAQLSVPHLANDILEEDLIEGAPKRNMSVQSLRIKSPAELAAEAEVVVVATFMDIAPAKLDGPGYFGDGVAEMSLRFRVARILKGKLDEEIVTIRTRAGAQINKTIREGEERILVLSPAFIAGSPYSFWAAPIKLEPEIRAYLAAQQGKP